MLDISIIIPIYNVEKYLKECLDSVKKITSKRDVEIIMIDDGSTDESGSIAKEYAEKYDEFLYYYQENGGLGKARNVGVSHATGKYLFFVDSDDVINAEVLNRMFILAEKNGTDLTICDAARIKEKKISAAEAFLYSFHNLAENVTHITKHPALVYDTTAWNKLVLRSFHEKHGFAFAEGYLYEDIPWAMPVHYYANGVSVLNEVGYYWRIRVGEDQSLTQQKDDRRNLVHKIAMFQRAFDFFREKEDNAEIYRMMEIRQWGFDYVGYLNLLPSMKEENARDYVELLAEFIEKNMTEEGYNSLPLIHQQLVHDILERDLEHLIRVNNYRKTNYQNAPIISENKLLVSDEIFTIKNRSADNEFRWKPARCLLDAVQYEDGKLHLDGHIYYRKINVAAGEQVVKAFLMDVISGKKWNVSAQASDSQWLTKEQGDVVNYDDYREYHTTYDGAGFVVTINFEEMLQSGLEPGVYKLLLEQKNKVCSSTRILRGVKKQALDTAKKFSFQDGKSRVKIGFDKRETLQVEVEKINPVVEEKPVPQGEKKVNLWKKLLSGK